MTSRLKGLAALLLVLVSSAWFLRWRQGRLEEVRPLQKIKASDIARVEIRRKNQTLLLEKTDGSWRSRAPVEDLADSSLVSDLVVLLSNMTLGSQVSSGPDSYEPYQLDESSATRLRLFTSTPAPASAAAPVFDGHFGKPALGSEALYCRLEGQKAVHLALGVGSYQVHREIADYRERAFFPPALGQPSSYRVAVGGSVYELTPSTSGWNCRPALNPEALSRLPETIAGLRAAEFPPAPPTGTGLEKPLILISAQGPAGPTVARIGRPQKAPGGRSAAYHYAQVEGRPVVLVSAFDVEAILKALGRKK